jgi:hypothetical protein
MFNSNAPSPDDLPTSRQLLRSTAIALAVALVILVTLVLPSEFALDPTGVGRALGLLQMGELKVELAREADPATDAGGLPAGALETGIQLQDTGTSAEDTEDPATGAIPGLEHETSITLEPNQGAEIKLEMKKGAQVTYHWRAEGGNVNFDTHGDPVKAPGDFYHGYGKGRDTASDEGVLEAAFDGRHGWYWRNRNPTPVTVILKTKGEYLSIKRVA